MKEKMKIFLKKIKNILPLLLACLLVGAMVLGLYLFSQSKQVKTLSASAEESSTVAESVESGLDLTQYPSANLLPLYDIKDNSTVNGVKFSVDPQTGIVLESGTATNEIWLRVITQGTLSFGTYTLSGCPANGWYDTYRLSLYVITSSGETAYHEQGNAKTFTVEEDCTYILYLFVANGYTVDNLAFKPMLNVGDVAYPFIPSFDRIYNNGYNTGYFTGYDEGLEDAYAFDIGYDEGYDKGYKEGLAKGQTDDPYDLGNFIFSIIDAPFRVIREALNFEFLGYDVSKLVSFLITALLVIFVVKKIKGG